MARDQAIAKLREMAAHAETRLSYVELYDETGLPKPTIPTGQGFARSPILALREVLRETKRGKTE